MSNILIIGYRVFTYDARLRRNAEALAHRGDSVDVICLVNDEDHYVGPVNLIRFPAAHYRVTRLSVNAKTGSKTRYLLNYFRFFCRAFFTATQRSLRRPYDLIMVVGPPDAIVFTTWAAKLLRGSKVVLDITDMMPELYRDRFGTPLWDVGGKLLLLEERICAWVADSVLAVHELHRRRLEAAGIDPAKIAVVMNSPDPLVFKQPARPRPDRKEFVVVYHGSLIRRLGVDTAIESINIARETIPDIRLSVLGGGEFLAEARNLVQRLGLDQYVTFHGWVPVERISEYLADADVGLVPNHVNEATHFMLPMKLLEYGLLEIPAIAAPLNAIRYYFGEDSVRYFKPDDAGDLANAIVDFYRHPVMRKKLAGNCRKVLETIGWENQCKEYYNAMDSLLASRSVEKASVKYTTAE